MLSRLIRGSLHHPRLVAAACVVFLIYGMLLARTVKLDLFPVLSPAETSVETEAPGMVAEQVEALVTRPIENALLGAKGVAAVSSQSIQGLSVVTLDFQAGADPDRVRQSISEGLAQAAAQLPQGAGAPRLTALTSGVGGLLRIGFTSDRLKPMALRDLVQWTVRPRLLSVPGVADVQVFGGETRRIEVRARAGDLSDSDLGYADVFNAVQRATGVSGAGFVDTPTQRVAIEPHGQALTATDVAAGQIQVVGSAPVRISDVADVVDAPAPAFGDALVQGKPGVVISIDSRYGADTVETSRALAKTLASIQPDLERQGVKVSAGPDRSSFITNQVSEIVWELAVGAVLLALLLVLFLRDWRAALVSMVSIPLTLFAAIVVLRALGWTLNTMTLGGMAVALGLIVDDAVIDVENVLRQLRSAEVSHASRAHAILAASLGVRAPVVYVTLMVALALTPIVLLSRVAGALLRPLAVSIIVTSAASLVVAIVVTPALALLFLKHIGPADEPPIVHRLKARYDGVLAWIGARSRLALFLTALAAALAAAVLLFVRTDFSPSVHNDRLTVQVAAPAGISLDAMRDYGARISRDLSSNSKIADVTETIGRAETGGEARGPEQAVFDLALKPSLSAPQQDLVASQVQKTLGGYPGLHTQIRPAVSIETLNRGGGHTITARLYGADLSSLDATAKRVADALRAMSGVTNVQGGVAAAAPVVRIDLNFQRLAIYGLSAADVLNTVQTAFEGRTAAQIFQDGRAIDIAVTAQASIRQDPEGAGDLLLRSSSGVSVPLKTVANVYLSDGRALIEHEGGLRSETVTADAPNVGASGLRRIEAQVIKTVTPPPGVQFELSNPQQQFDPSHSLALNAALAGAGVVVLLLLGFGSVRAGAIVLASTLFALIGGVVAVALMGGVLSLGALMGFFALFGLSARNAALLITRLNELAPADGAPLSAQSIRRAAHDRFSPIAISAVVVCVALLPIALRADRPGHEILAPMAFVILCGVVSATLLGLALLPAMMLHLWRPSETSDTIEDPVAGSA